VKQADHVTVISTQWWTGTYANLRLVQPASQDTDPTITGLGHNHRLISGAEHNNTLLARPAGRPSVDKWAVTRTDQECQPTDLIAPSKCSRNCRVRINSRPSAPAFLYKAYCRCRSTNNHCWRATASCTHTFGLMFSNKSMSCYGTLEIVGAITIIVTKIHWWNNNFSTKISKIYHEYTSITYFYVNSYSVSLFVMSVNIFFWFSRVLFDIWQLSWTYSTSEIWIIFLTPFKMWVWTHRHLVMQNITSLIIKSNSFQDLVTSRHSQPTEIWSVCNK